MKLIFNIWFEKYHRFVFDNYFIHDTIRRNNSNIKSLKILVLSKFYFLISPLFKGWRFSLKINLPNDRRFLRYEPKKLDLLDYEFNHLNSNLKIKYLQYKLKECKNKK